MTDRLIAESVRQNEWANEGESTVVGDGPELLEKSSIALRMGLLIWDEYMSQIKNCVSQDYARLNKFPILCNELGIRLPEVRNE